MGSNEIVVWSPPSGALKHLQEENRVFELRSGSVDVLQSYATNGLVAAAVWSASVVLAAYLESINLTKCRIAIELGAGASGIPSIALARAGISQVIATDGEATILELLEKNLLRNNAPNAQVRHLRWDQGHKYIQDLLGQVDLIVAADCTYHGTREDFLAFLKVSLALLSQPNGILLLAHTSRYSGDTEHFLNLAQDYGFRVETMALEPSTIRAALPPISNTMSSTQIYQLRRAPS